MPYSHTHHTKAEQGAAVGHTNRTDVQARATSRRATRADERPNAPTGSLHSKLPGTRIVMPHPLHRAAGIPRCASIVPATSLRPWPGGTQIVLHLLQETR